MGQHALFSKTDTNARMTFQKTTKNKTESPVADPVALSKTDTNEQMTLQKKLRKTRRRALWQILF